ncbi:MAG TPA: hypothetical protein VHC44_07715, partial [Verrucomicrobiae bacterium]|nr:hypothetical protein [Verrucomicrobiae bacterium]
GTVTQSGALVLVDAGFTAGPGPQQFGELQLGTAGNTNSTFTLSPGACALHFANSSSLVWSNSARLIITNWNGSPAGGGSQQIFFGSNNSGLTSQQLSQVQFLNPAGLPIGTYSARILSSGEVVPDQNQGQGSPPSGTVNSWISSTSGNWQDAASWSLGLPPASSQSVMLTNAGFKAVSIQSSTASGFPQTLAVNSVTIASPTNSLNTLLMNFVGAGSPLVIGVDSNTPGSLIISDTNSAMAMFSSGLIVNNALGANNSHLGEFEVDGTFTQSDGSEVVAGFLNLTGTGSYNMTNGELFVGTQFINGKFHQQGGSNLGSVIFTGGGGEYDLFSGSLKGGVELDAPLGGRFIQSGGTNTGGLGLDGPGIYQLSGGLLVPGDLSVGPPDLSPSSLGAGTVEQTGGTNNAGNITMGVGNYDLEGGVLTALNLTLPTVSDRFGSFGSSFNQSGGYFSSGGVDMNGVYDTRNGLQPATYTLSGGELITPAINLTMGRINQTGGTNNVGVMTLNTVSSYVLNGGVLIASNLTQNGQTAFSLVGSIQQSGGTNEVMDVLYVGGGSSYDFTNGLLIADNIQVAGQAMFVHAGGSFGGMDNIVLAGGGWVERTAGEQLGQLQLGAGTNSSLNLPSGSCALRFADSSSVPWSNDGRLTIQGWSGSLNGGGAQQIFFGTTGSGLIAQQLSQILFSDPAGLPTGTYTAQILSTGEIVPDQNSSTSGPVDSWIKSTSGNWDDASAWSLGTLPNSFESVLIANSGSKAVAINPSTSVNFPDSMTVTNLFIRGATNTENTLLLNNFGTTVPFTVLDGMILQDGAQILNLNSGLVVQGGAIEVTNSQINQDGGFFIATNTAMALNDSFFNLTNGVFACGSVSLGYPTSSHFNQYGGTAIITNLSFASYLTAGIPNGISLYGGTLDLPGGMDMYGEPGGANYFQSGGTNRTGQVNIEVDYGGFNPNFTLNGGLLADSGVLLYSGYHAPLSIMQSGGTHTITNTLLIKGSSANGYSSDPATYNLSGGALAAGSIELDANDGDSVFVQTNGNTSAGTVYTHSVGYFSSHNTIVDLLGGSLNCSNYTTVDGGGQLNQSGGALVVSNLLDFGGTRDVGITLYGRYTFTGGTLTASNINISGDWMIGDGSSNRISNPGVFSLSHLLQINDAVEQLGHFVLASNATIDLAGSSSRLSFANSSSQTWAIGATLVVTNWNGDPSGGGVEQLKFGSGPSGLTPAQLNQIQFSIGTNLYPAKILASGEVVPNQTSAPTAGFSTQGNNFVVTWPAGWTLQSATNASGPYNDVPAAVSPYTNDMTLAPRRFFRLRQ